MACMWFCSDWHLGHANMAKKYRGYNDVVDHDEYFIAQWLNNVSKRDTVYCLGDMALDHDSFNIYSELPAEKKILVLGNHDLERGVHSTFVNRIFDDLEGCVKYKEFWLTHMPMHPVELHGKINLHGHVHGNTIGDDRYVNICPENLIQEVGRPLIKLEEIRELLNVRGMR